ncbi:hypothetical protein CDAR_98071 [Caerostris darwini]|uniref:Uncharacterized protein n=1 Tax=Caerostris darwini TaxID=1538125 RepID=A0AAV4SNG4_9ARAC|nr:hypothetical protein CDAR_98071 [Caerostris darwini]
MFLKTIVLSKILDSPQFSFPSGSSSAHLNSRSSFNSGCLTGSSLSHCNRLQHSFFPPFFLSERGEALCEMRFLGIAHTAKLLQDLSAPCLARTLFFLLATHRFLLLLWNSRSR